MRELEATDPSRDCAGERTLDVTEELALDEPGRDRAAVHLDERPVAPRAPAVEGPCDELLARPGLAADQDRGVARRDRPDLAQELHQRRMPADDLVEVVRGANLLLEVEVLLLETLLQTSDLGERLRQRALRLRPLELRAGARREDRQHRDVLGRRLHRLGVQDRDVAEHAPGRVLHRHADVAVRPDLLEPHVLGEELLEAGDRRADASGGDVLAGRAGKAVAEARAEVGSFPVRERPGLHRAQGLGDERVAGVQRLRGVARERAEELLAGRGGGAFDEDAEHAGSVRGLSRVGRLRMLHRVLAARGARAATGLTRYQTRAVLDDRGRRAPSLRSGWQGQIDPAAPGRVANDVTEPGRADARRPRSASRRSIEIGPGPAVASQRNTTA